MIKNLFNVTIRNIWKHKGYSFINIVGLAIGMACCLLISLWVLDELSFDRFHENADALYRVEEDQFYSGRVFHVLVTPHPLAPALVEEIPEIIDATRYVYAGGQLFRYGDKSFFETGIRAVDPSFFEMFSFPLISGDRSSLLKDPYSLVVSQTTAKKYFGEGDPVGRIITVNNKEEFTVTGVFKDIPHNSSLQCEVIIPYEYLKKIGRTNDGFGSNSIQTFVQLEKSATKAAVDQKIKGFIKSKIPQSVTDLSLMPYPNMHLRAYWGYEKNAGAIQYVYIFSVIAFFVLLIACINFMNLSTARSASRAKEVGLRKVVGAFKSHLIRQFFGESVLFSSCALILAVGLVTVLLGPFSRLSSKPLSWDVAGLGPLAVGLAAITLFTGVIAGSYPALFLSSFQPVKVLKGSLKTGAASSLFRKVLVVVQFTLSVILIIGTAVVYKQVTFMKNKNLGWDKEHVLYISMRGESRQFYKPLKAELVKDARILGVTGSETLPSNIGSNSSGADWDGKDPDFISLISHARVDYDYVDTLKIEMKEGRFFSMEFPSDLKTAFVVNEEVVKLMGKESAVGERFRFFGREGRIIGVMKDFHFQSTRNKIEPLALYLEPDSTNYLIARIAPQSISGSLKYIEDVWDRTVKGYPFEYHFLDEVFDEMYRAEQRIGSLLNYFSLLAIFIACLGLFGLASFTAEQRTKEVGIRKILGATVPNITYLLCREFFILVILSNLLAWPAAYFIMKTWLQSYAYRTGLEVLIFFAALGIALVVALISVGFQALRAAMSNPADSLRYE